MNRKINLLIVVILFLLVLTGCASNTSPKPLELTIEMSEFAFSPKNLEFQVGQEVTIHLKNVGALDHEIMFGRNVEMEDGQPHGYETDMFMVANVEPEISVMEGAQHNDGDNHQEDMDAEHGHDGFMVEVPVGDDEYTMAFTVTEEMVGEWEIGCFDQNGIHYTAGMIGTLTVIP